MPEDYHEQYLAFRNANAAQAHVIPGAAPVTTVRPTPSNQIVLPIRPAHVIPGSVPVTAAPPTPSNQIVLPIRPAPVQPAPVQPAPVQPAPVQPDPVQAAADQPAADQPASYQWQPDPSYQADPYQNNLDPMPLVEPIQLLPGYSDLLERAVDAVRNHALVANLDSMKDLLLKDIRASIPLEDSQVAHDIGIWLRQKTEMFSRINNPPFPEAPINTTGYPVPVELAELGVLNPGRWPEWTEPIRHTLNTPQEPFWPPSPGPKRPQFFLPAKTKVIEISPKHNEHYPPLHPNFVDFSLLKRNPFMEHPKEDGESELSSIPLIRYWDEGVMFPNQVQCAATTPEHLPCPNLTNCGCEDQSHYTAFAICDDCEEQSRARLMTNVDFLTRYMRQYLCHNCLRQPDLNRLLTENLPGQGAKVYFDPDEINRVVPSAALQNFAGDSIASTGLSRQVGYSGPLFEITGCSCALKLFGRRICSPHRLQYMMNIQTQVSRMKEYCKSLYGRMVCPCCRMHPGIDNYAFQGENGGVSAPLHGWVCLNCQGYVFAKNPTTGPLPVGLLSQTRNPTAPPPYNVTEQGKQEAKARLAELARQAGVARGT
ncbi:hypothetical protein F4804DRAFT_321806 [Jackrogersella minutella]|nr:hypothetical protein F4804DRAFT_321806 [Jackrogersella minutella]